MSSPSDNLLQLPDWLGRRAMSHRNHLAISHETGELSYHELYLRATKLAGQLAARERVDTSPVALVVRNGFWYTLAVHGLMQANITILPINWRLTEDEIAWQLQDAGVQLILHDELMEPLVSSVLARMPSSGSSVQNLVIEQLDKCTPQLVATRSHVRLSDIHAIIYTSGTTGKPKGTLITYANHWWSATGSSLGLGLVKDDRWLVPMPLFHVGGLAVLMRSLIYGTTAVIHDSFDEQRILDALQREAITLISVVPTMLARLLAAANGSWSAPKLRCVLLGGSSIPRPLLENCERFAIPVASSYGMTETNSQAATLPPEDAMRKFGSAGRPLFPTEIAIYKNGEHCEPFIEGEILVRGPTVTPGYLNRPEATAETIVDGWLHTGDVGYLDEEGYLFMLDRRSDLIVSGGENIYPAEVESVLLSHEDVVEAGVVGVNDSVWGQIPVAVIVTKSNQLYADELTSFARQQLAGYKVPKQFILVDSLPRNASGKLLRRKLKEWLNK